MVNGYSCKNPLVTEKNPRHQLGMKIITYGDAYLLYSTLYTAAVTNEDVTTIDMTLSSPVPQEGENILNHMIDFYVKSNIDEKIKIADSTISFY